MKSLRYRIAPGLSWLRPWRSRTIRSTGRNLPRQLERHPSGVKALERQNTMRVSGLCALRFDVTYGGSGGSRRNKALKLIDLVLFCSSEEKRVWK
jgi:hypothetical protein